MLSAGRLNPRGILWGLAAGFTAALGYLLFGEAMDAGQIAGALLVVVGIASLQGG